ncbi:MAG: GNAT family N-acetyltransferase [Solirubrobacterales bacterium]
MLEIRSLKAEEVPVAARLVADGMAENPIHAATWPDATLRRHALQLTFELGQERSGKWALAGFSNSTLVAVAGISTAGSCRPSPDHAAETRARLADRLGEPAAERYRLWRSGWGVHDPDDEHWHFGPFTVLPDYRRRGVGTEMLEHFCKAVDEASSIGYLEADRVENVPFYRRQGFAVVGEDEVLGVRTWYMRRPGVAPKSNRG